jgi:hypothetical protein
MRADPSAHDDQLRALVGRLCFEHLAWQESGYRLPAPEDGSYLALCQLNKRDLRSIIAMLAGTAVRAGICDSRELHPFRPETPAETPEEAPEGPQVAR